MTDTVPVSRELLRQVIGAMIGVFNGEPITGMPIVKSVSALRAALDSTCQDSRQVPAAADKSSIAAEWVRCAAHGAQHDVREIIADMQAAPVQEPVYAFRRKGMDDFCTCNKARFDELASKPHLFETAIFYTSQPRTAVKLSDSEIASDASRHWSEDGVDPIAFAHAIESAVWAKNGWAE